MIDISEGRYWDLPWSLVDGCTPCSPGCEHCWAASMRQRFEKNQPWTLTNHAGQFNGRIIHHYDRLDIPMKRRKPTVYAVWNDLFHEAVPFEFVDQVFNEIGFHDIHHTFLILSKRPKGMLDYYKRLQTNADHPRNPFPNVWSGLTVCNQEEADEKTPVFLQLPGKKFYSIEPMLGAVDIHISGKQSDVIWRRMHGGSYERSFISAVILGGETGPGARPMHPDWVRSVRDQCAAAGVPFFFKGWGEWAPWTPEDLHGVFGGPPENPAKNYIWPDKSFSIHIGRKAVGRLLNGRTHDDLPWREVQGQEVREGDPGPVLCIYPDELTARENNQDRIQPI